MSRKKLKCKHKNCSDDETAEYEIVTSLNSEDSTKIRVDNDSCSKHKKKYKRGKRGEKGEKGDKGDRGDKGCNGNHGCDGERGERGEKGCKGDKGEKGCTGDKGDRGDVGPQGFVGPQGPQGRKGDKGDKGCQGPAGDCFVLFSYTSAENGFGTVAKYIGQNRSSSLLYENSLVVPTGSTVTSFTVSVKAKSDLTTNVSFQLVYHTSSSNTENIIATGTYTHSNGDTVPTSVNTVLSTPFYISAGNSLSVKVTASNPVDLSVSIAVVFN